MAIKELSPKLKGFKNTYSNIDIAVTKKNQIVLDLTTMAGSLDSITGTLSTAGNDSTISEIKNCVILSKDGVNRVKECVEEVISKLETDCNEVVTLIGDIEALIGIGEGYENDIDEKQKEIDSITINENDSDAEKSSKNARIGSLEEEISELNAKILAVNEAIEINNDAGEDKLDAMQEAMSSLSFGVAGNMTKGGSLGTKGLYECGYKIQYTEPNYKPSEREKKPKEEPKEEPKDEPKEEHELTILQEIGCGLVGGVEGVAKAAEGVLDTGATIVGAVASIPTRIIDWLGSVTGWYDTKWTEAVNEVTKDVVSYDIAGNTVGAIGRGLFGEGYDESTGRNIGETVGRYGANVAASVFGGPIWTLISQASVGGNASEGYYKQGGQDTLGAYGSNLAAEVIYGIGQGNVLGGILSQAVSGIAEYIGRIF